MKEINEMKKISIKKFGLISLLWSSLIAQSALALPIYSSVQHLDSGLEYVELYTPFMYNTGNFNAWGVPSTNCGLFTYCSGEHVDKVNWNARLSRLNRLLPNITLFPGNPLPPAESYYAVWHTHNSSYSGSAPGAYISLTIMVDPSSSSFSFSPEGCDTKLGKNQDKDNFGKSKCDQMILKGRVAVDFYHTLAKATSVKTKVAEDGSITEQGENLISCVQQGPESSVGSYSCEIKLN